MDCLARRLVSVGLIKIKHRNRYAPSCRGGLMLFEQFIRSPWSCGAGCGEIRFPHTSAGGGRGETRFPHTPRRGTIFFTLASIAHLSIHNVKKTSRGENNPFCSCGPGVPICLDPLPFGACRQKERGDRPHQQRDLDVEVQGMPLHLRRPLSSLLIGITSVYPGPLRSASGNLPSSIRTPGRLTSRSGPK